MKDYTAAGLLLGTGLGGLLDGIVAHQILGWHHMLSGWIPTTTTHGLHTNIVADGYFHLGCLVLLVVGTYVLHRSRTRQRIIAFTGLLMAGWGLFNVVEGLVDHQILGIHHVRPGPGQELFDIAFLLLGVLLIGFGTFLYASRRSRSTPEHGDASVAR